MGFWNALFGGQEPSPEEKQKNEEARSFDMFKYDGVKAARIGQFDYAVKCYEKALQLKDDPEVRDYLARAQVKRGDFGAAMAQLRLLAEAAPDNVAVVQQLARVAYMAEDYATMEEACAKAQALDGNNADTCFLSAQAAIGQGNPIQAVALLTKAVTLNANFGDALLLRGKTLLSMGDVKGAAKDADSLLERYGDNEDVLLLKARVEHKAGHAAAAIALYNKVTEVNPFSIEAFKERGQVKYEQGDTKGAQEDMQKVLELNPDALADVSGDYSAEGVENKVRQAYSFINPLGI